MTKIYSVFEATFWRRTERLFIFVAMLLSAAPTTATTITLDFNTLPSAQGWTFVSNGPLEAAVFSVDGTTLTDNTMGTGFTYAHYLMPGVIDPLEPFTIESRVRVLQSETAAPGAPATAFQLLAYTGVEEFGIGLNTSSLRAPYSNPVTVPFDATQFHDYRIEAVPGVSIKLYIDALLVLTTVPPLSGVSNSLYLGNASSFENGLTEITRYSFSQEVPEPSSLLLVCTAVGALVLRGRSRHRGR